MFWNPASRGQRLRQTGVLLVTAGCALLALYAVPAGYGVAASRLAVARFRAESSAQRDWDASRILAYKRSLELDMPAPMAVLRIPRLAVEVPVLEGTDELTLNRAAGHIQGTAEPGAHGNVGITAHRDGFFRPLKDIQRGDELVLERRGSSRGTSETVSERYIVQQLLVVSPHDTSSLQPTEDSELTLVTCYPFHFVGAAPQRFVVRARLAPPAPANSSANDPN